MGNVPQSVNDMFTVLYQSYPPFPLISTISFHLKGQSLGTCPIRLRQSLSVKESNISHQTNTESTRLSVIPRIATVPPK